MLSDFLLGLFIWLGLEEVYAPQKSPFLVFVFPSAEIGSPTCSFLAPAQPERLPTFES
jgi:hypothetical protein